MSSTPAMLRGLHRLPRSLKTVHNRSFVSTVLLSRKWENETVMDLRKEAKARGLSTVVSKGNKSTLVARIQGHEESRLNLTSQSTPPVLAPSATRSASTKVAPPPSSAISQADSPGIPLPTKPNNTPPYSDFLAIRLPNLSQPALDAPVQVPYLPDIWDSAKPKEIKPADIEPELPKLHVVSGSATHYAGGPTYKLEKPQESGVSPPPTTVQPAEVSPSSSNEEGSLADLWESLGLPRSFSARRASSDAGKQVAEAFREKHDDDGVESRPLTDEERKGVYVLLGIIGGSWLLSSFVNPSVADEDHTHTD